MIKASQSSSMRNQRVTRNGQFPALLATPRLMLRPYVRADSPGFLDLVNSNRRTLQREFEPITTRVLNDVDAADYVNENADKWTSGKEFCYGIWHEPSKSLIGQLRTKNIVWEVPAAELSYFVDKAMQRQAFATEAIRALVRVAFTELNFRRICIRIVATNKESLLLAQKLGFAYEGVHRNEFRCGFGELHDVHHYSLTDADDVVIF
jgi:RimJ/RimL family protein N-acetyltransferase